MPTLIEEKTEIKKPVRLQDVARAAGISLATASLALNGRGRVSLATQQEVRRIAQEMGFEADLSAQRLATGHSNTQIGLFTRSLDLGVGTRKLQILQGLLFEKGYNAAIHSSGYYRGNQVVEHAALLRDLRRQRPLAIVVYSALLLNNAAYNELKQYADEGGHLITFDTPSNLDCDQVIFDRADSAEQATTHLLELGHRQIAFAMPGIYDDSTRVPGYRNALHKYDVPFQDHLLFNCQQATPGEIVGRQLAEDFLSCPQKPTAICIPDDIVAASFIAALYRQGISVPCDLSVVSHDDLLIAAHNFVPLSTVSQPMKEIAQAVVELLTSRIEGRHTGESRTVTLYGQLITRQSTLPLHEK